MILVLLLQLFTLGVVDPQTANVTKKEFGDVERNQTFREFIINNGTWKLDNVTLVQIEEELQKNRTTPEIREDDESFQEQEQLHPRPGLCHQEVLVLLSRTVCLETFHQAMMEIGQEDWCHLDKFIRPYNQLTTCMENLSGLVGCYYPNQDVQDFFYQVHWVYFRECRDQEELLLEDAPQAVVLVLTLIPVSLIPVLVYLLVWKGKVQE